MPSTNNLLNGFIDLLLRWPKLVLVLFLLLTIALAAKARQFDIDASPDTLLTKDNLLYTQTQLVNQRFSPQEFLLVTYTPKTHPVISAETFAAISSLSGELLALERVQSVRSILNVPVFPQGQGLLSADIDLTQMTIETGDYSLDVLREEFTDHPIYENLLINEDMTAVALQVLFRSNAELQDLDAQITALNQRYQDESITEEETAELERLEEQVAPLRKELSEIRVQEIEEMRRIIVNYTDDADIHMGGAHVLGYQLIQIITNDLVVFGSAIAIGICLMLLLLFRALRWVMIPILCCIVSVVSTMGLFAIFGIKATVISSNFIALQLILTLALVIHLVVQFREISAADSDISQKDAIRETLRRKIGPCFFAGLTTSVGFGSLVFSGIQPVIDFGWMMIIAMFFSILVSLTLFPVLLEVLSKKAQREDLAITGKLVSALGNVSLRRPWLVGVLSLLVAAFSVSGVLLLNVENSFINYFKKSTLVHQELAYIDQEFGGSTPLDLVYTSPDRSENPDIVMSAITVQTLQLIQHRMSEFEATGRILSAVNLTDLARELNNNRPLTEYELTAAYWLMDEDFKDDLLGAFYNVDTGEARINIWIKDLTEDLNRAELLEEIHATMEEIGIPQSSYTLTNLFVLYQDILQRLFTSQIMTLGLVYIVLTLTFLVIFRSIPVAIAAIIPNILSTLAILGVMGWLGIPLDLMTITIAAIAMGIAVDDTIHFIHRYLDERESNNYEEAIKNTLASVGVAIMYTSLLIVVGFSMLGFSDFVPSILFGLLTALSMVLALLTGLCLLPVLLKLLVEKRTIAQTSAA